MKIRFLIAFYILAAGELAAGSASGSAYVLNRGSGSISVIDTDSHLVTETITVGSSLWWMSLTPDGTKIYVGRFSSLVNVIDIATSTVTQIDVGGLGWYTIVTPDGSKVYVTNSSLNRVHVIDTATDAMIATINTGADPSLPGITPDGSKLYVPNQDADSVSVINISTNSTIATHSTGDVPFWLGITPNGSKVYVLNSQGDSVTIIDTATENANTIAVGNQPTSVAFTPDSLKAYVPNIFGDSISVIDTATDQVTTTIALAPTDRPYIAAMSLDGSTLYVSCSAASRVAVIDTTTDTLAKYINVGSFPFWVALRPDGKELYVGNRTSSSVSVIDTTTKSVTATVAVGSTPWWPILFDRVQQPSSLTGRQVKNVFATQTDLINVLTWNKPAGPTPVRYRIYRNAGLTDLVGAVESGQELKFQDHNRRKGQSYTYYVVSVDAFGNVSTASNVTITP